MASGLHPMSLLRRVHHRVTTKVGGVRIGIAASILAFLIAVVWDANWPTSPWNVAVSLIAAWLVVYGFLFALNALYLLRHASFHEDWAISQRFNADPTQITFG